jgi:hypothetical protein
MGHCIQGFIAKLEPLRQAATTLPTARVAPLAHGLGFLPMIGPWVDLSQPAASPVETIQLTVPLAAWAAELLRQLPVAYIETDYFGGMGSQAAVVWQEGLLVFSTDSINEALVRLGIVADPGQDEFDTVGLGRWRSNEKWYADAGGE